MGNPDPLMKPKLELLLLPYRQVSMREEILFVTVALPSSKNLLPGAEANSPPVSSFSLGQLWIKDRRLSQVHAHHGSLGTGSPWSRRKVRLSQ
jgi:hypothetical protein